MHLKGDNIMIKEFIGFIIKGISNRFNRIAVSYHKSKMGFFAPNAFMGIPDQINSHNKIFIGDNSHIFENAKFLISSSGESGKFVVKQNVAIAQGFTVVTGNHKRTIGKTIKENMQNRVDINMDVIIENDVWIGANVTLLAGVHIGRGANIGAGSVVRYDVPPYSIVIGNPSKVIGFSFNPDEVIEHERVLYSEEDRLPLELLEKNYEKFFLKRLKEIKEFTKL